MTIFTKRKMMHNLALLFKREKINGKSQKEAADFLGIDHRSVSRHMKQNNIALDVLYKYAEYLEVDINQLVATKLDRQVNGYISENTIKMYADDEERPILTGIQAAPKWWINKKTIIIIDKNDPKGHYYNMINFYDEWNNSTRIKDQALGLYQSKDDQMIGGGTISRKNDKEFICRNFYDGQPRTLELKRYARFIAAYNLNDLPVEIQ